MFNFITVPWKLDKKVLKHEKSSSQRIIVEHKTADGIKLAGK